MSIRISQFEDAFFSLDQRYDTLKKLIEEKTSREEFKRITSDKISREELGALIPNEEVI
jgi:hypothetical protein